MKNTLDNPIRVKSINTGNEKYLDIFMPAKPIAKSEYYTVLGIDPHSTLLELKNKEKVERLKLKKADYKDEAAMAHALKGRKIILYFVDDTDHALGLISSFMQ